MFECCCIYVHFIHFFKLYFFFCIYVNVQHRELVTFSWGIVLYIRVVITVTIPLTPRWLNWPWDFRGGQGHCLADEASILAQGHRQVAEHSDELWGFHCCTSRQPQLKQQHILTEFTIFLSCHLPRIHYAFFVLLLNRKKETKKHNKKKEGWKERKKETNKQIKQRRTVRRRKKKEETDQKEKIVAWRPANPWTEVRVIFWTTESSNWYVSAVNNSKTNAHYSHCAVPWHWTMQTVTANRTGSCYF